MSYETHDILVCVDCILFLANGETTEHTTPESVAISQDVQWPLADGWRLVPGSAAQGFSWSSCDGCGCTFGGERHEAHAMREFNA